MHAALLIDSIVRQTTVLIAALATRSGQRAQLAHVANQVFADLVRELRDQGVGNKVIADMFGMALRTYRRKVARMSESRTEHGRSLWEAVLRHVQQHGPIARGEVLKRFARDDDEVLRSVLVDLIETGLISRTGAEDSAMLEATRAEDAVNDSGALDSLVLVALHRSGPLAVEEIAQVVPADISELETALARLVESSAVILEQRGKERRYRCESFAIAFGDAAGWEAAVFDHYQAMVVALVAKLRGGERRADLNDAIGGSTFAFHLWEGHPMQARVLSYLRTMREQGIALRRELEEANAASPKPAEAKPLRVVSYVGQSVMQMEGDDE